ncbi:MAG: hypothetical protein AAF802_33640, partial [Planctomycetota bacterium]
NPVGNCYGNSGNNQRIHLSRRSGRFLIDSLLRRPGDAISFVDEARMIDSVADFSDRLNQLDPDDDAFVLHVDDLVEQTSPDTLEIAHSAIFRFFGTHPENDCGMPGTLIHMMEDYYPNYVDDLVDSIGRTPSANAVLMVNRILNSDVDSDLHSRLIQCLRGASMNDSGSPLVKEEARRYLDRHA